METLGEIPLRAVHAYETDEDEVVELELPVTERRISLSLDGRMLTIRFPRPDRPSRWHMNAEVTGL